MTILIIVRPIRSFMLIMLMSIVGFAQSTPQLRHLAYSTNTVPRIAAPTIGVFGDPWAVNSSGQLCLAVSTHLEELRSDGTLVFDKTLSSAPSSLAIDSQGNCYALITPAKGTGVLFTVTKFDSTGNALLTSSVTGTTGVSAFFTLVTAVVDSAGNVWAGGTTNINDAQLVNPIQNGLMGSVSSFIAKFDSSLKLVFSTYLGGTVDILGNSAETFTFDLTVDSSGNAYLGGGTTAADLPTVNPLETAHTTTAEVGFLSKIDAAGHLQYSTYIQTTFGGNPAFSQVVCGVATDPNNNILLRGAHSIVKLNPTGSTVLYQTNLQISASCSGIAADSQGNAYTSGSAQPLVNPVQSDLTISELFGLDPSGNVIFASYLGNVSTSGRSLFIDFARVGVDSAGNLYVVGARSSSAPFPLLNPLDGNFPLQELDPVCVATPANCFFDGFVAKIALGPGASFSMPTTAIFGSATVGTAQSPPLGMKIYNTGTTTIGIQGIGISGDYTQTNDCPASLSPATLCSINVTFAPTAAGTRTGAITITDDSPGSPHIIQLTGTAAVPAVSLNSQSLTFASQVVSTTSDPLTVTLTNTGGAALNITHIAITGDFAETNTCGTVLNQTGTCAISITFSPSATGSRTGTLTITDNAPDSPQVVNLSGTGVNPSLGLGVSTGSSNSATVQAGATANYSLTVGGQGVSGTVNLSCTGAPTTITCNIPATANINASTASTIAVTVNTTARTSASVIPHPQISIWAFTFGAMGILFLPVVRSRTLRSGKQALLLAIPLLILFCSCGGSSGTTQTQPPQGGTTAGMYMLTVTASMGATTQSTALTLTVK